MCPFTRGDACLINAYDLKLYLTIGYACDMEYMMPFLHDLTLLMFLQECFQMLPHVFQGECFGVES